MKPVNLLWVVHFHQPVGNFEDVFARYTKDICKPLVKLIVAHPGIRANLHFSGPLLEYFDKNCPPLLAQLTKLAEEGRIELLGGGFYEPFLPMIPDDDGVGQLKMMAAWIKEKTGQETRGAWLPESVWEPRVAGKLNRAGYRYTLLDDSLFLAAGVKPAALAQPFRTEYMRGPVTLLPIQRLGPNQSLPHQAPEEFMAGIKRLANRPDAQCLVIAQSGDQFEKSLAGGSPLAEGGSLDLWLKGLEAASDLLKMRLGGEYTATLGNLPQVHIPPGGSFSIQSGSLPASLQVQFESVRNELRNRHDAARFEGFIRGGVVQSFLAKYSEIDRMHKKMLWLHDLAEQMPAGEERGKAVKLIWESQCHTAYWHAERGGCYANYLRDAVYQRLIAAEKIIYQSRDGGDRLREADYDGDNQAEVLLRGGNLSVVVQGDYGATCSEFNFLPGNYNLANSFTRRAEAYHQRLKEPGKVPVDWYERRMFQDHFAKPTTTLAGFLEGNFVEHGDFVNQMYALKSREVTPEGTRATFVREGGIYMSVQEPKRALRVEKTFRCSTGGHLGVDYEIENTGTLPIDVLFAVEVNYTCLSGTGKERYVQVDGGAKVPCGDSFESKGKTDVRVVDTTRWLDWKWEVKPTGFIWHHPVVTVAAKGNVPELDYQGSALIFAWPLSLHPGERISFGLMTAFV